MSSTRIVSGNTPPGNTNWQVDTPKGIVLDVDTSVAGFTATPQYFTSIGGKSSHFATTGATSIYRPTNTGFRVYVRWADGNVLTPDDANGHDWHINWLGVGA